MIAIYVRTDSSGVFCLWTFSTGGV